jgi:maltose alpha-D-glucosyltransferase/alpha-amylase
MAQWLNNAVFYEIYPQSFQDSNGDGIGDFQGIINRLDYIQELGFNAIWINPCFLSPFGDAGYDVSDYCQAAPRYGTNADLERVFREAHARGMHVLLDLVPGHTSVEHSWFKKSILPEHNDCSDRYIWSDNIWEDMTGVGSISGCLRGISQRNGSVAVNFFSHQPALNYGFYQCDCPWQQPMDAPGPMATREAIKNVMRFWLKVGADGFRVDMAGSLVKNDPESKGTIALWQDFRAFLDREFPDAAIISEWGEPDKSLAGGFHMDFMLHFGPSHYLDLFRVEEPWFSRRGKGNAADFVNYYKHCMESTNGKGIICVPSGNHDMIRMADTLDAAEAKIAYAFLFSLPGAPFLYYGDEIGMAQVPGLTSVEGGFQRTGARTPMQWDARRANDGFSAAPAEKLYIAQDPRANRPTVAAQQGDPDSLYNTVKALIALRAAHTALQSNAKIEFLYCEPNAYPMVYRRSDAQEQIVVVLNPAAHSAECPYAGKLGSILYQNGGTLTIQGGKLCVPPQTAVWMQED